MGKLAKNDTLQAVADAIRNMDTVLAQKEEIIATGQEVLKSIPEDYSAVLDDIGQLKEDKLTKPADPPTVGKILKVKSVNEDGTFLCEWADGGSGLDVQIDGTSIAQDGVAEIPIVKQNNLSPGLIRIYKDYGIMCSSEGYAMLINYTEWINKRMFQGAIYNNNLDYAVKVAMCDGKGAAWTADEQASARERMGACQRDYRLIADVTLKQEIDKLIVEKDIDGNDISLKTAKIFAFTPIPREDSKNNGYVILNDNATYYGAIDWKNNGENSITVVDIDTFGEIAPTIVKFSAPHKVAIAQTSPVTVSLGNILSYYNEINKIVILSNYYFDIGTRIVILGKR